jgi:acylpyruvate hydrolase
MSGLLARGRKIVGVGRNYVAHAHELGNEGPVSPILFLKPTSSYITVFRNSNSNSNSSSSKDAQTAPLVPPEEHCIQVPHDAGGELHHEVELGVVISKRGSRIAPADAHSYIHGYVLALDMTARGVQAAAKKKGLPWSASKGSDTFCPVSDVIPAADIPDPQNVELWCSVDGEMRQKGNTNAMIWDVAHLISHISEIFTLDEGDCILTGTPEGVGPIKPGQSITAGLLAYPLGGRNSEHGEKPLTVMDMTYSVIARSKSAHVTTPLKSRF